MNWTIMFGAALVGYLCGSISFAARSSCALTGTRRFSR